MVVHGADITGESALRVGEEPQDSNNPRWEHWRQTGSCQRCGHRAAQERVRGSWWHSLAPPSQVRPPARCLHGARSKVGPSRSRIWPRPLTAVCAGARWSWFDAGSALSLASSRSTPRGLGSTDHGLCVLHEDPTYPKYPQPSSSSTPPSCSASRRHRQPPQSPGQPLPTSRSSSSPLWQTHPTGVLRGHDIRNPQKS